MTKSKLLLQPAAAFHEHGNLLVLGLAHGLPCPQIALEIVHLLMAPFKFRTQSINLQPRSQPCQQQRPHSVVGRSGRAGNLKSRPT